jgi:HEAT repeat protein
MRFRSIVSAGLYASLVPLLGATGTWTDSMSAAPIAELQAPARDVSSDIPVHGGRLERRNASQGLQAAVDAIVRADQGPSWIAWRAPAVSRDDDNHHAWSDGSAARCVLDDDGEFREHGSRGNMTEMLVLARTSHGALDRLAFTDERCTVQAGSRTIYWLDGVTPGDSVRLLDGMIRRDTTGASADEDHGRDKSIGHRALPALALHDTPEAERALTQYVAQGNPRWLRRDAAFWLGASRGSAGAKVIDRLARTDPDDSFREHLTFVLTLTGEPGVTTLLDLAKHDQSTRVRGQALFWLGQKAGQRATAALGDAVNNDPDSDVRKRAVFAISQLPKDQSVPKLIELAKTHRDPEVRKQAMFWLGQTGDERAVAFFESVLKGGI